MPHSNAGKTARVHTSPHPQLGFAPGLNKPQKIAGTMVWRVVRCIRRQPNHKVALLRRCKWSHPCSSQSSCGPRNSRICRNNCGRPLTVMQADNRQGTPLWVGRSFRTGLRLLLRAPTTCVCSSTVAISTSQSAAGSAKRSASEKPAMSVPFFTWLNSWS